MKSGKPLDPDVHLVAIRAAVAALRVGEVVTYGQVAERAGLPGRARLVGFALRTVPREMQLPWHRVVGAGGRIAFPQESEAAVRQARLLRAEGVEVIGRKVVIPAATNLDALLWGAPAAVKMTRGKKGKN